MTAIIKSLFRDKVTILLAVVVIIFLSAGFFLYQRFFTKSTPVAIVEVDLAFDPEGPYALLYPRRDGNALVLDLKRTASYDKISYELAYVSTNNDEGSDAGSGGIDRGVSGNINTKDKKGEYEQEILFGTCSKNVCKYDTGVENGTLTLHIQKGNLAYKMVTQWHLQKPGIALGKLSSLDNHLLYQIDSKSADLALIGFSIINDLSGAPKLPGDKQILGKVYGVNAPVAKSMPGGQVTIELPDNPPLDAKISRFDENANKWMEFDTKIEGSKLTAKLDNAGVITILSPKK